MGIEKGVGKRSDVRSGNSSSATSSRSSASLLYQVFAALVVASAVLTLGGEKHVGRNTDSRYIDDSPVAFAPTTIAVAKDLARPNTTGDKSLAAAAAVRSETKETAELYWWQQHVEAVSVAFRPSNNTDWCVAPGDDSSKTTKHSGLFLVKIAKTGSSTAAAATLQIAESVGAQKYSNYNYSCPSHVHHGLGHKDRVPPFFLWSVVRNPHKRSISGYFFTKISRKKNQFDAKNLIQKIKSTIHYQTNYLWPTENVVTNAKGQPDDELYHTLLDKDNLAPKVLQIFRSYDFIAVTERMDESLVVLKLLFGFRDETIVALNSKTAGSFDDGQFRQKCHRIQKSYTTPEVDEYIETIEKPTNVDYFLYAVANRSLDKTIDALGRDRVEREVVRLRELRILAEETCAGGAVFPCTEDGAPPNPASAQSCYFGDVGCNHECVKDVVRKAKPKQTMQ